jgi:hypothetical protein
VEEELRIREPQMKHTPYELGAKIATITVLEQMKGFTLFTLGQCFEDDVWFGGNRNNRDILRVDIFRDDGCVDVSHSRNRSFSR